MSASPVPVDPAQHNPNLRSFVRTVMLSTLIETHGGYRPEEELRAIVNKNMARLEAEPDQKIALQLLMELPMEAFHAA